MRTDGRIGILLRKITQVCNNLENLTEKGEVPFRIIHLFLGIVGALPFTWKKPHFPSLHPTKSTLFLSIAIYMTLFFFNYRAIRTFLNRMLHEDLPTYTFISFASCIAICVYCISSCVIIADVPAAQQGIRHWLQLNRLYRELTNRSLVVRWRTLERGVLVMIVLVSPCLFVIMKEKMPVLHLEYEHGVSILHTVSTIFSVCWLWIAYYSFLQKYAKDINKELSESIERNSLTSEKLRAYQDTWIELKKFSDTISLLHAPFIVFVVSLVYLVLIIFLTILFIQAKMYYAVFALLVFGFTIVILLTGMAKASDLAVAELKNLHSLLLAQLNVDLMRSVPQYQVLNMFFVENLRVVTPTYGGFVVVNKALIPSLFVAVTLNVVVLAQVTQKE